MLNSWQKQVDIFLTNVVATLAGKIRRLAIILNNWQKQVDIFLTNVVAVRMKY